ncbi:transposable element Tc3 transposase [Trichonephila clavipes]|nr:transposable element Tc3 transposase [Trichonephila clavipes]
MSQRRRLPNSLRWRAVGWMEMGLSQADAARRLNVSRSVVQRLWDQYQSEDSVSRPVPGRPQATTPAEDRFLALSARRRRTTTVPQLVADHFQASGRRISATTVRNRLHNADESRFTMESDSGRLLIWREQRTRYHQSNTVERHSYRGGGILVLAGISLGGHTDLHVFHGGTVTGLRYRDEILDPYVRPYAAAIGNDFILMDDNARPHRARIVEEYLEDHGLERMEWPARSPDLNPIEHLWDYLGREVAALNPPPKSLHELKEGLLCVWSSLPIPVSGNLINSMGNRCRQGIQLGLVCRRKINAHGLSTALLRCCQGRIIPVKGCVRTTLGYLLSGALIGHCRCRLPKWEAKTRNGVNFVPDPLRIFEEDLKQQPVYQDSPKNFISDLSLEIELVTPFSPNQDPQGIPQQLQLGLCIIIHQNEDIANCTGIWVDIWINDLISISHISQSFSLEQI